MTDRLFPSDDAVMYRADTVAPQHFIGMTPFSSRTRRCDGDLATARLLIGFTAEAVSVAATGDYSQDDWTVAGRVIAGFIEIGCTVAMDYVTGLM